MKGGILAVEGVFLVLWSSGVIGAKYGLPYAGTFTLLFFRYLMLSVVLFGWLAISGKLRRFGGDGSRCAAWHCGFNRRSAADGYRRSCGFGAW